jgi:hypothetical protein
MEACDPCAEAIVAGCWGHDDLHPLSDEQKAALAGEPT